MSLAFLGTIHLIVHIHKINPYFKQQRLIQSSPNTPCAFFNIGCNEKGREA